MIGTTLGGRYAILAELGKGGMGAVYEARHLVTGRRVAVKVIHGDAAKNPATRARFEIEARAAGSIESQYVAHVLDVGYDEATETPFMAMELLEGEDIQRLVQRLGPLPVDLALRIAAQASLGLAKAHADRFVHRDIKSANLFLSRRDEGECVVKLLDFGIAKVMMDQGPADHGLTRTGSMIGSPFYMSPEQARASKAIDHRTNLWSLGVVLHYMLAGRTPFAHAEALGEMVLLLCAEPAPPVTEIAPWVPAPIAAIVSRCLTIDLAGRFATATELFEAIRAHLPGGFSLDESMLVPLDAATRATVSVPPPRARVPPPAPPAIPPPASAPVPAPVAIARETTRPAPATIRRPSPASRAVPRWALVLGGGLVGAAVVAAAALAVGPRPGPRVAQADASPAVSASASSAASQAPAAPGASAPAGGRPAP